MKRNHIYYIALALMLSIVLLSCRSEKVEDDKEEALPRVKATPAELVAYRIPVRATGLLATSSQMKLSFKTGGIIQRISALEGRSVSRGEELAKLDLSEIQAQVQQARIGLEKAGRDLERAANLYRDSVVTLEQYQDARSAYELAQSTKKVADFNLRHSTINAPSNGRIQKVLAEENELIAPGHPVLLFASSENDWVLRASVTDKAIVQLSLHDSAAVYFDPFPGQAFAASVSELASVADPVSGTYEVELRIPDPHPEFRTGFIARCQIWPREMKQALIVPVESLQGASDRRAELFVYTDGMARKRKVRTGAILGDRIIIEDGIREGELILTEGADYLRGDSEVELITDAQ